MSSESSFDVTHGTGAGMQALDSEPWSGCGYSVLGLQQQWGFTLPLRAHFFPMVFNGAALKDN